MREIMNIIDCMNEELHDAKHYAQKCIKVKSTDSTMAKHYQEMANDELKHAMYLYENAAKAIEEKKRSSDMSSEILEEIWDKTQDDYTECTAKVRCMMTM